MTFKRLTLICSIVVLLNFSGCQGIGPGSPSNIQAVNHIIFMMQENRSFDAYFGKINDFRASAGQGRDLDDLEAMFSNPADDGTSVSNFHLATSCIFNTTAAWQESHGDMNRFAPSDGNPLLLDGFVHTA